MYTVTDLGTLGGTSSEAFGINNLGEVVGDANLPGDGVAHAFLYSGGVMHDLGTLGGTFNQAAAINDLGQVVGEAMIAGGAYHAFIYSNGTMQDLGTLGGTQSGASGINNASTVVGYSYTDSSPLDACGFTSNNGGPMVSTGGFTGVAINSSGDVTGTMLPYAGATAAHGYVFPSDGSAYDIGTLGGAYCSPEAIPIVTPSWSGFLNTI
jgi:probable HAF family extracellular repeat protein